MNKQELISALASKTVEHRNSRTQEGLRSSLFSVIKFEISLHSKFDISDLSPPQKTEPIFACIIRRKMLDLSIRYVT
jgi:hypothetical protein